MPTLAIEELPKLNYDDIPNFYTDIPFPSNAAPGYCPDPFEEDGECPHIEPEEVPYACKADAIKPQYSLIPLDLLTDFISRQMTADDTYNLLSVIHTCHDAINDKVPEPIHTIQNLMNHVSDLVGLAPACYALQYGVVKYARDNWKLGFGGDYKRLLEATIRHSIAHLMGEEYDGEALEGFPRGNMHLGAIYFSLMVACNEAFILLSGAPRWKPKEKI